MCSGSWRRRSVSSPTSSYACHTQQPSRSAPAATIRGDRSPRPSAGSQRSTTRRSVCASAGFRHFRTSERPAPLPMRSRYTPVFSRSRSSGADAASSSRIRRTRSHTSAAPGSWPSSSTRPIRSYRSSDSLVRLAISHHPMSTESPSDPQMSIERPFENPLHDPARIEELLGQGTGGATVPLIVRFNGVECRRCFVQAPEP